MVQRDTRRMGRQEGKEAILEQLAGQRGTQLHPQGRLRGEGCPGVVGVGSGMAVKRYCSRACQNKANYERHT